MTATSTLESQPVASTSSQQSLYEASTQYRHWRFSPKQLVDMRYALNSDAVSAIRNAFENDSPGSSASVAFLSAQEEYLLVKLYVGKVSQLCAHFRFPEEVEATAVTYLKRFYLKNTVMDWHPKNVMLTALFLATKTTNHPISLESYASHIPKTAPSDVLDLEFLVAQSLGFDFAVWHPHRSLWGIWLDIQTLPDVSLGDLQTAYEAATKHVRAARLTDAEFIYTPSQIALACFSLASPTLASAWARAKFPSLPHPPVADVLGSIEAMILREGSPPDVEAVREVDRRLRLCKNPEKIVGSNAYNKKLQEKEKKAEEKRIRKAEAARIAMEEGDPFGNELAKKAVEELDDDDDDD
ncbi:cyclin-like protein [Dichomitus squalens]|uniref:Cyclin-like protein n=1 Tax=Dichomitus squalens TaxID=114155 RepID=A0A4V2K5T5_9APHY|nr:cyclin-like protein [Dichomitus squalens LYAD-421 SS1]EJF66585.1 cyclin-like protein [Dichomitus squalens LYAD-421 SS1]TBU49643.1 cyclin-like protein [Dichomitus squalens]TBU64940.1 cyclin-like protein [Dichomitus squalens]